MNTKPFRRRSVEEIAEIFGCTPAQVGAQFAKNHEQLREMYEESCATGRKVRGYTAEQLRARMNSLPMSR